MLVNSSQYHVY